MTLEEAFSSPKFTIIDVRTEHEFENDGQVKGSINIPLHNIPSQVEYIRTLDKPIILCCRSGNRSEQACIYLDGKGLDLLVNGSSWNNVEIARKISFE